uniref:Cadherin 17, LI cadherin (liver-intestine) n=1 Tax=Nothobranchius furzeri TaxID=105023 RepID=A0A8C6M3D9_NOTFU
VMTPMVHLLLLPFLCSIVGGTNLEEKKGPFVNTELDVPEGTPVPYAVYQFQVTHAGVNGFRLSGEGKDIKVSKDGWLYLEKPLDWSQDDQYILSVEALADNVVVDGPVIVTINVLDVNNNAPQFNQSRYTATVREKTSSGVAFTRVFASDRDDPETANALLSYSLVSQIPNNHNILMFQIHPDTGEISTTREGERMLKARAGIQYSRGEDRSIDALKTKFEEFCPVQKIPYEENPFFTCVERAELRRRNVDPLEDPDYTLIVRAQDMGGASEMSLSGNTRVHIVVQQNLWVNPGPIPIKENLKGEYPQVIAKVQSNDPDAIYSLVQKERELKFPFQITEDGEILVTEELDREDKEMYILVVFAKDGRGNEVDPPLEIYVRVEDVNDNEPVCEHEESVFEIQEDEPVDETALFVQHKGTKAACFTSIKTVDFKEQVTPYQILTPLPLPSSHTYDLQIDARNPEPLMKGLEYGGESTAVLSVCVTDVDEAPEFSLDILDVTVAEDITKGSVVFKVEAKDPEGKEISFKMDGDSQGWLELDAATGEIRTKENLDREKLETFELTVIAFETDNPEKSSERVVHVRLLDVNDNVPKLIETQTFICMQDIKPIVIKAQDGDSVPFSQPFTFAFVKKSPNWELRAIDGTTAEVRLKKKPIKEATIPLYIDILDSAGLGVTQLFEVKVCNCTELGHCYIPPQGQGFKPGLGTIIGILAGVLGVFIVAVVAIKRSSKKSKKKGLNEEEERNAIM